WRHPHRVVPLTVLRESRQQLQKRDPVRRASQRRQLRRWGVGAGDDQRGRAILSRAEMGQPASGVTVAPDRFFESYYRLRPVTATFTGLHQFDRLLPDWSLTGLTLA